ncbi:unnamed protein product [Adineta steineri]|uniref:Uncharacterized protein n=1 Tax=Adineta steineri TaxID=433720 RepID=A0A818TKI1_9BILA|nr:unnamed protein product [Adineta steineri]
MNLNKCFRTSLVPVLISGWIFIILLSLGPFSKQSPFKYQYVSNFIGSNAKPSKTRPLLTNSSYHADVLLIYVYANVHRHAYENLKYFIENAVREQDGVDYIFILQQTENKSIDESKMPPLPKTNAFYFQHENKCFDFGTMGWFFSKYTIGNPWQKQSSVTNSNMNNNKTNRIFDIRRYKYFIFMNSSTRGPFFPPYFLQFLSDYENEFNAPYYWYYIFTKRINDKVKLAGPTVACTPVMHVQSYLITTDFTGLTVLLKSATDNDGKVHRGVFGCYPSQVETITFSELSITTEILSAGYMITGLMAKYQLMNFSKNDHRKCTVYGSPYTDKWIDGTSLEPYDVVFVKYNNKTMTIEAQGRAKIYEQWMKAIKTKDKIS